MMSSCMAHWAGPSHGASRRAMREAAWAKKHLTRGKKGKYEFPACLWVTALNHLSAPANRRRAFHLQNQVYASWSNSLSFHNFSLMEWVLVVLSSFTSIPFFFSHCFCWAFFEVINWMTQPFNLCLGFSTTTCNLCILTEIYGSITSFDIRDGKYLAHPVLVLIQLYPW